MTQKEVPKDPERMTRMLATVNELKQEKYIGTAEALFSIRRRETFKDSMERITSAVNRNLKKEGHTAFTATPERIVGIFKIAGAVYELLKNVIYTISPEEEKGHNSVHYTIAVFKDASRDILGATLELSHTNDIFSCETIEGIETHATYVNGSLYGLPHYDKENPTSIEFEKLINVLSEEFIRINKEYWSKSVELDNNTRLDALEIPFAFFLVQRLPLSEKEHLMLQEIQEGIFKEFDEKSISVNKFVKSFMPKDVFTDFAEQEESCGFGHDLERNAEIQLNFKLDRMFNDGIDHRLEARREILADVLKISGSYEAALDNWLENARMANSIKDNTSDSDLDPDDPYELANKYRNAMFILQLLGTEKRWCENYLKS